MRLAKIVQGLEIAPSYQDSALHVVIADARNGQGVKCRILLGTNGRNITGVRVECSGRPYYDIVGSEESIAVTQQHLPVERVPAALISYARHLLQTTKLDAIRAGDLAVQGFERAGLIKLDSATLVRYIGMLKRTERAHFNRRLAAAEPNHREILAAVLVNLVFPGFGLLAR